MKTTTLTATALIGAMAMAGPAMAGELVPVAVGLPVASDLGSPNPEELDETGRGSKTKAALKIAGKATAPVRAAMTVNSYAKAGWELGRLTSKNDPGPYPGFRKAVLPSLKRKGR
jgi:hypothetical protein